MPESVYLNKITTVDAPLQTYIFQIDWGVHLIKKKPQEQGRRENASTGLEIRWKVNEWFPGRLSQSLGMQRKHEMGNQRSNTVGSDHSRSIITSVLAFGVVLFSSSPFWRVREWNTWASIGRQCIYLVYQRRTWHGTIPPPCTYFSSSKHVFFLLKATEQAVFEEINTATSCLTRNDKVSKPSNIR